MGNIKSEWKIRDYVIAGVVLSAVIALAYLMVGSLATEYDTPGIVDAGFSERYHPACGRPSRFTDCYFRGGRNS